MSLDSLLSQLNPAQRLAVSTTEGPLLVLAGAGTGKTRVITYRIANLLRKGVKPESILAVTFTNRAAKEMRERVGKIAGGAPKGMTISTFHSLGARILRAEAGALGYRPGFSICDASDQVSLARTVLREVRGGVTSADPKAIIAAVSRAKNRFQLPEELSADASDDWEHLVALCYERYQTGLRDRNCVDFDDLILLPVLCLEKNAEVGRRYKTRYRFLLVDEYQDTNRIQSDIVEMIAGPEGNLMVVGDDAQSIYSFRGANFENILHFPERHPGTQVFRLEINYRSSPEILNLANSSIKHNTRQFPKTLRAVRPEGGLPEVVAAGNADEQARFVGQQVLALRDEGYDLRDVAVLYRAHYHSMELQMELTRLNIPFQVRSGLRFFEQAHIKDVAAYLKVAVNGKDELAWKRILKIVPRIGKTTAEKVWALVEKDQTGDVKKSIPKGAQKGWENLVCLIGTLRTLLTTPAQMIKTVLESGYESYLETTFANFSVRIEDLRRFADFSLRYDSVETLLSELALTSGVAGQDAMEEAKEEDSLVLSTVHQAKGLEWRAVFVLWLVEGKFPDGRAIKEEGGEEEERRLFYVASTRAKDRLYLVFPTLADERYLFNVIQRVSRFVKELDRDTYDEATVTTDPF